MISAANVQDQELPIRPERTGIDHPAVGRRGNLGTRAGGDGDALFGAAIGSGVPNSFILTPLTGIGTCPRKEAKATAGARRPGSRNADSAGRLSERAASRASRVAGSRPCSSLAIKSLRLSTWSRQILRHGPARASSAVALGLLLLTFFDQRGHAGAFTVERGHLGFQPVALGVNLFASVDQGRKDR